MSLIPTGNTYLINILRHIYIYFPNYQYLGIDDILQALSSFKELVHILAPISDVMDALLTFVGENFHVLLISLSLILTDTIIKIIAMLMDPQPFPLNIL